MPPNGQRRLPGLRPDGPRPSLLDRKKPFFTGLQRFGVDKQLYLQVSGAVVALAQQQHCMCSSGLDVSACCVVTQTHGGLAGAQMKAATLGSIRGWWLWTLRHLPLNNSMVGPLTSISHSTALNVTCCRIPSTHF
jgi:hypothetical protein